LPTATRPTLRFRTPLPNVPPFRSLLSSRLQDLYTHVRPGQRGFQLAIWPTLSPFFPSSPTAPAPSQAVVAVALDSAIPLNTPPYPTTPFRRCASLLSSVSRARNEPSPPSCFPSPEARHRSPCLVPHCSFVLEVFFFAPCMGEIYGDGFVELHWFPRCFLFHCRSARPAGDTVFASTQHLCTFLETLFGEGASPRPASFPFLRHTPVFSTPNRLFWV